MDITKEDLINDLNKAFREQNDVSSMTDEQLIEAWKKHGIHAGTWGWDEVVIVEGD